MFTVITFDLSNNNKTFKNMNAQEIIQYQILRLNQNINQLNERLNEKYFEINKTEILNNIQLRTNQLNELLKKQKSI